MDDLVADLHPKIKRNGYTKWFHKYINLPPSVTEELKRRMARWKGSDIKEHVERLRVDKDRHEKHRRIYLGDWSRDPYGDE